MSDCLCMHSGDTVIFENRSNPHQIEIKFAFLKYSFSCVVDATQSSG
jgi:hypothetical protein